MTMEEDTPSGGGTRNGRFPPLLDARSLQVMALKTWGPAGQRLKLIEEMGELLQVIASYEADVDVTVADVYEEMVGVRLVLDSLGLWVDEEIGCREAQRIEREQLHKLKGHLEEQK